MFNLLTIISGLFLAKEVIKEKTEQPAPKGTRFDWDAYWKDVENGMSAMDQVRKRERGGYMTTKPLPPAINTLNLPKDTIVDQKSYDYDVAHYGKDFAEIRRRQGWYRVRRML